MTNIAVDLNDFPLPRVVTYDYEYSEDLYKYLDKYATHIKSKVGEMYRDTVNTMDSNILQIKRCIASYYNGKISEAYNCIKNILQQYVKSPFIVAMIDENYAFRGSAVEKVRPKIYSGGQYDEEYGKMLEHSLSFYRARIGVEKIKGKDMLHIPSHTSHTKIRHTTINYAALGIWKRFFQFSGSLLIKRDTSSAIWHSDAL